MSAVVHSDFCRQFRLSNPEKVVKYFPEKKSVTQKMAARAARILHYLHTGAWIDEGRVCAWAADHPQDKISSLLKEARVYKKVERFEQKIGIPKPS